jgi:hypothetical protein
MILRIINVWENERNKEANALLKNDEVKEDEMGKACSTNGGDEECI